MFKNLLLKNIILSSLYKTNKTLLSHQKSRVIFLVLSVFFLALLELIGLAIVVPVVNIALNPSVIERNNIVQFMYCYFGFSNHANFSFVLFNIVIFFFLAKNILSTITSYYQSESTSIISGQIGQELINSYYKKDLNFFNNVNTVELLRNVTYLPNEFTSFILMPLITFFNELLISVFIITSIALYNFQIFIFLLFTIIPAFVIIFRLTRNKVVINNLKRKKMTLKLDRISNDFLKGYIDIQLLNKQEYFSNEYYENQKKIAQSNATIFAINQSSHKSIELISILSIFLVLSVCLYNKSDNNSMLNLMTFFIIASYRMLPSLNRMIMSLNNIKGRQYVFEILNSQFSSNTDIEKKNGSTENIIFEKEISLNKISFSYPKTNITVINKLNYKIKKGKTIGIIGESGSGKTTLINIILGFLSPLSGEIKIDDEVITNANLKSFRRLIGYVKQNVFIFDGDIIDNIAIGVNRDEVDIEKINHVIQLTKLNELVKNLPHGLNTHIGEQGAKISGGQKQRLAIARALYHNAEILIFDEATSDLDNETEKAITDSIEMLLGMKTMIIIAHRYSTLKNCDEIIEIKNGEISRMIDYETLIQENI